MDYEGRSMAVAHQDVSVKLGGARDPVVTDSERHLDLRSKIIPLVANATVFDCGVENNVLNNIGTNCTVQHYKNSPGECWKLSTAAPTAIGSKALLSTSFEASRRPRPSRASGSG
jgi:hypothetical protein